MPGPCSGKIFISVLVTDYIRKKRGEPGYQYMDRALGWAINEIISIFTTAWGPPDDLTTAWQLQNNEIPLDYRWKRINKSYRVMRH